MTPRERVIALVKDQPIDHLALMPITMMFASGHAGIKYGDYCRDFNKLVEAQLRTAETFGFDYVSGISDPAREASDLGAAIEWFDDQPPAILESQALLAEKPRLMGLHIPDPATAPRMHDRVEAVRLLRQKAGQELLVEGWV